MKTYSCVYLGSALLALVITPVVIRFARRIRAFDVPGVRTVHTRPVPRIGGIAIFCSTTALTATTLFLNNRIGETLRDMQTQYLTLLCSASFVFLIGLVDDLRGLPARVKFLAEMLASGALCAVGVHISSITVTEEWTLQLGFLGCPLSILWIVGITNAVNLSDGLDGLAAGISAIACGTIAIFAIQSGNLVMSVLMLALVGSLSGFLFFNSNPAKIFMGDCGSLFLGFTIASSSILCSMKSSALVGLALPFLALGIPIFDTLFSMLRRFLERRSILAPDRRHFHHRLIESGLKQRHVVLIIYVVTLISTGLGMLMMITRDIDSLVIFFCILLLLATVFRIVGSVRLRASISALRKKYEITRRFRREQTDFEQAQLYFYDAKTHDQWWEAICKAAEQLGFVWLSLKKTHSDGQTEIEVWRMSDRESELSRAVVMAFPFTGNGDGMFYEFEIAISVNGSYESAGYRATLFNRLIDEYAVVRR